MQQTSAAADAGSSESTPLVNSSLLPCGLRFQSGWTGGSGGGLLVLLGPDSGVSRLQVFPPPVGTPAVSGADVRSVQGSRAHGTDL